MFETNRSEAADRDPVEPVREMRSLVREGYEKIDYEASFRLRNELTQFEEAFFEPMCDLLATGSRILDLGCGPGIPFGAYLSRRGYRVTGVDFCLKHVRKAAERVPKGRFICGDVLDVCLPDAYFDAVVSLYTVFHLPRAVHPEMIRRIHGTLRSGGVCLLTLGASESEYGEERDWLGAKMAWSSFAPGVYARALEDHDFQVLQDAFEGSPEEDEYHWWVLVKKG